MQNRTDPTQRAEQGDRGRPDHSPADAPSPLLGGRAAAQRVRRDTGFRRGRIQHDPRAAAFFDVDNTIVQGASMFHLAKGLYRRDFFPLRSILWGVWLQVYFRMAGKENPEHIRRARESALAVIKGHTVDELVEAGREIYHESIEQRIWPGTRAIAQLHLDVDQPVWLVTAAPIELAAVMATKLGLSGALGSVPEHHDGVYTGRLVGDMLHGQAKADAVLALADEHGYDLSRCHAYSDSHNDLPLLSLVGYPCAINPDHRLREHARTHGWEIRDYRTARRALRAGLIGTGLLGGALGTGGGMLAAARWFSRRRG